MLGVEEPHIPEDRQLQISLLRTVFTGRKVLVVLDNLDSEAILRLLLATDTGSAVIATSRSRLTGLSSAGGAQLIELSPLADNHAAELASSIADRLTDEESREVGKVCAGLPMAISIVASLVARRPNLDVMEYVGNLAHPDHGMEHLRAGQSSMEVIIEDSYRMLDADQSLLLRTLGLLPNTTVTTDVITAAMVDDMSAVNDDALRRTNLLLDDLFELNLIEQPAQDSYRLHDVIYRFARHRALAVDEQWRRRVVENGCLMYAARFHRAAASIGSIDHDARIPSGGNRTTVAALEQDCVGAAGMVEAASKMTLWNTVVVLAGAMTPALDHLSRWADMEHVYAMVRLAGEESGNDEWLGIALHNLGQAAARRGNPSEASTLFHQSSAVAARSGIEHVHYLTHMSYGSLLLRTGQVMDALPFLRRSLRAWRHYGDDSMLVANLELIGKAYMENAQLRRAEKYFRNALKIANRGHLAGYLPSLGIAMSMVLRLTGRCSQAEEECRLAILRAQAVRHTSAESAATRELALIQKDLKSQSSIGELESVLQHHRETGDVEGETTTLLLLGMATQEEGMVDQAVGYLDECIRLSLEGSNPTQAARSMAILATIHGNIGEFEEADDLIREAEEIAADTGNEFLLAQVHELHAEVVRSAGDSRKAVGLLRQVIRTLEKNGLTPSLINARTLLGEALLHDGQWHEASVVLRSVTECLDDAVTDSVRASAFRFMCVLYSRRELWEEAVHAGERALEHARQSGSSREEMHCCITIGNLLARMQRWADAVSEYEKALPVADQLRDLQALLTIRANQAACWHELGQTEKSIYTMRASIKVATELRLIDVAASMRVNLGNILAGANDLDEAINEFSMARESLENLSNQKLKANAILNLGMALRARGDYVLALTATIDAREIFQREEEWHSAAKALALELSISAEAADSHGMTQYENPMSTQDMAATVPTHVLSAAQSLLAESSTTPKKPSTTTGNGRRRIHVVDQVRDTIGHVDIDAIRRRVSVGRQTCHVCQLPIAESGQAELIVFCGRNTDVHGITLTHSACAESAVIYTGAETPRGGSVILEVECILWGGSIPGVVVDCHGPWGIDATGRTVDVFLNELRRVGFHEISHVDVVERRSDGNSFNQLTVKALIGTLIGDRLSILSGSQAVVADIPLSFIPDWYRATRLGYCIAVFGFNLQGMAWNNPDYLVEASESGNLVGGAIPIKITTPGRNSQCICTPRTYLKFKHCCGRPTDSAPTDTGDTNHRLL